MAYNSFLLIYHHHHHCNFDFLVVFMSSLSDDDQHDTTNSVFLFFGLILVSCPSMMKTTTTTTNQNFVFVTSLPTNHHLYKLIKKNRLEGCKTEKKIFFGSCSICTTIVYILGWNAMPCLMHEMKLEFENGWLHR